MTAATPDSSTSSSPLSVIHTREEPVFPMEGDPFNRSGKIWKNPAGTKQVGAFETVAGARLEFVQPGDESLYIASGRARISVPDGPSFEVHSGDLVQIVPGTKLQFEVFETLRGFFVLT
jgi:uncharacterized cupin superfamily protein